MLRVALLGLLAALAGCAVCAPSLPCVDDADCAGAGTCGDEGFCVRDDAGPDDDAGAPDDDAGAPCGVVAVVHAGLLDAGVLFDVVVPVPVAVADLGFDEPLRFTATVDGVPVPVDVDRASTVVTAWVRAPSLAGDAIVEVRWGPTGAPLDAGPWAGHDLVLHGTSPLREATGAYAATFTAPDGGPPAAVFAPGVHGDALACDGGTQIVVDDGVPVDVGAARVTMTAWVRGGGAPSGEAVALSSGAAVSASRLSLGERGGAYGGVVRSAAVEASPATVVSTVAPGDAWHHVAIVVDYVAAQTTIYVDGVTAGPVGAAFAAATSPAADVARVSLCASEEGDDFWTGAVDEVRVLPAAVPAAHLRFATRAAPGGGLVEVGDPACP